MTLLTTTIGAYPKPNYVTVPNWFGEARGDHDDHPTENWADAVAALGEEAAEIFPAALANRWSTKSNAVSIFPPMARFGAKTTFIITAAISTESTSIGW